LSARYYHSDHVGSNTLVTRSDGSTVQESVLDPFGELLHQPLTSASNAYLFTDQERDGETGLDYFEARYYDPRVGRFMSVDPESLGGVTFSWSMDDTQQTSVYSYAANRPTRLVDPTGRFSTVFGSGGCVGVSGCNDSGGFEQGTGIQLEGGGGSPISEDAGSGGGSNKQSEPNVYVGVAANISASATASSGILAATGSVGVDESGDTTASLGVGIGKGMSAGGGISGEGGVEFSASPSPASQEPTGPQAAFVVQATTPFSPNLQSVISTEVSLTSMEAGTSRTIQPGRGSSIFVGVVVTVPLRGPDPNVMVVPTIQGPVIISVPEQ